MKRSQGHVPSPIERVTLWIGSYTSLYTHSAVFVLFFVLALTRILSWDTMLLLLTTIVSLEAIYLAILIQITINRQEASLREVEADVDEIQEDMQEIQEDVQEMQEDVEEIQKDVDELQEDVEELNSDDEEDIKIENVREVTLSKIAQDMAQLMRDIEELKKK